MEKIPSSLVYFEYNISVVPNKGQEEYLQITQLVGIGKLDKEPKQKIIRLNEEQQLELYTILHGKFYKRVGNRLDEGITY